VRKTAVDKLETSMRPGLLPRRYYFRDVWLHSVHTYFNEAGAFAPEILARVEVAGMATR